MKNKNRKFRIVLSTCLDCGGRGIIARGHLTRKRNSQPCPDCNGTGEVEKRIPTEQ